MVKYKNIKSKIQIYKYKHGNIMTRLYTQLIDSLIITLLH